jgi:hypothetical protein
MDQELIPEFVEESQRALSEIEADLLKLESGIGGDAECLNRIFEPFIPSKVRQAI